MESLRELYRIGPGPSSSHTLAVRNACLYYLNRYPDADRYLVELYGSLALTGRGHMSDRVVEKTIGKDKVDILFNEKMYGPQPNTMVFHCLNDGKTENEMVIYSTGGGAIAIEGEDNIVDDKVYPQKSLREIMDFCQENGLDLAQYVHHYEPDIDDHLDEVLKQMLKTIDTGLTGQGVLPGALKLEKVAQKINQKAMECEDEKTRNDLLITSYAYAAMEENACGETVVTAPTLGSCGVVSSLVYWYHQKGVSEKMLKDALAVAGIFGNLVKTNGTISGAVGGCQAEIGTACCMAAAMCSYLEGLNSRQIEYAAEVAMEHNLGLTCDPVGGYVQVPCIERNGVAALRALDCMLYGKYIGEVRQNRVSFDMIIETMSYTGHKLAMELRETSLGGLAVLPLGVSEEKDV
ncbi:MAG: L-serine ammonia-lyase, iron-sulfur-dependent, subunit alpha [Erysipelotrichaceae bacterium]|nr:L-serine ammonia-lyase, iron-sulfur-dependent, subunit alpha [Erysipelotrichaceae bacterium]